MGMRRIKPALDATGYGQFLWGLLPATWQTAISTGLTAASAYLGYQSGGLFYALLGGVACFAFCMVAIHQWININRLTSVYHRLHVGELGLANVAAAKDPFRIPALTMQVQLKNDGARPIFFRLHRASHSLAGRTNDAGGVDPGLMILPENSPQQIVLATLSDIPITGEVGGEGPKARIEIEIDYGPSGDNLAYRMHYIANIQLGIMATEESAAFTLMGGVKVLTHTRL
jgi:hypothetical protein